MNYYNCILHFQEHLIKKISFDYIREAAIDKPNRYSMNGLGNDLGVGTPNIGIPHAWLKLS